MFNTTYYKVEKKLLKQIKSDLDAIIGFEKTMHAALNDKRMPADIKLKLAKSVNLMQGAENNTSRIRRELLELLRNNERIIKE